MSYYLSFFDIIYVSWFKKWREGMGRSCQSWHGSPRHVPSHFGNMPKWFLVFHHSKLSQSFMIPLYIVLLCLTYTNLHFIIPAPHLHLAFVVVFFLVLDVRFEPDFFKYSVTLWPIWALVCQTMIKPTPQWDYSTTKPSSWFNEASFILSLRVQ